MPLAGTSQTFGYWWIRRGHHKINRCADRTIRLPMGCGDVFGKLGRFVPEFVADHGRQPTLKEQAEHVGCSVDALRYYMAHISGRQPGRPSQSNSC